MPTKACRMREIVERRKAAKWPKYCRLSCFHQGRYECDHVSPYTRGAGDLDADVFILLQDWSSSDKLGEDFVPRVAREGRDSTIQTNKNLTRLLRDHLRLDLEQAFATNLFPFIKLEEMSGRIGKWPRARIDRDDFRRAAREFALPQVDIVSPRIVICLGLVSSRTLSCRGSLTLIRP